MNYSDEKTIPIRYGILLLIVFTVFAAGCGKAPEKTIIKPDEIAFRQYYPLAENAVWKHQWEDNRGDRWFGALAVLQAQTNSGSHVYIIADSTERYSEVSVSYSAYMWDDQGLKHLYRVNSNGDSTTFTPARLVLPSVLKVNQSVETFYHFDVYPGSGGNMYSGDVKQIQKLVSVSGLQTPFGKWDNTALVETVRTDNFSNGSATERRSAAWYARNTGPVQITTGIPPASADFQGDTIGYLMTDK